MLEKCLGLNVCSKRLPTNRAASGLRYCRARASKPGSHALWTSPTSTNLTRPADHNKNILSFFTYPSERKHEQGCCCIKYYSKAVVNLMLPLPSIIKSRSVGGSFLERPGYQSLAELARTSVVSAKNGMRSILAQKNLYNRICSRVLCQAA